MIDAVVFDMDGVLIDSELIHLNAYRRALGSAGTDFTLNWFRVNAPGIARHEVLQKFSRDTGQVFDIEVVAQQKANEVDSILRNTKPEVSEDLLQALTSLSARFPLAVATSSTSAIDFLKWSKLLGYFNSIVTSDDVARGKPAPDIFLEAARQLKVSPKSCVVIEDSAAGVQAARAAGMTVIGYSIGGESMELHEANAICTHIAQLPDLLSTF